MTARAGCWRHPARMILRSTADPEGGACWRSALPPHRHASCNADCASGDISVARIGLAQGKGRVDRLVKGTGARLDQPAFNRHRLNAEKLIVFNKLEQLSASNWTRVALYSSARPQFRQRLRIAASFRFGRPEHDPQKGLPVLRKGSCSNKRGEPRSEAIGTHEALSVIA